MSADRPSRFLNAAGHALRKLVLWISGNEADIATSPTLTAGSGAPSATEPNGSLYQRTDGAADTTSYARISGSWVPMPTGGTGASTIADTNTYYAVDTVNGALDALALQIGGDSDAAYNFTEANLLSDDDAVYAALQKIDLFVGDLASVANGEGAALVGVEDAAGNYAGATVEAVLAELAKYVPLTLADPGTGQAIPVTRSASIAITTAAAETNTLAIPTFIGQRLILICDVYAVGDRVITSAQPINQTGNTIMTFGAAGDFIVLEAAQVGGALRWRVVSNDGVALS